MVAELEADLNRMPDPLGMRVAKAKGRLRGKQPKLNPRQEAHLVGLHRAGEHSTAELADLGGAAWKKPQIASAEARVWRSRAG